MKKYSHLPPKEEFAFHHPKTIEKQEAVARLDIYLSNSVGIGEHPQHMEEMDKLIEEIASNNDKLEALNSLESVS